MFSFRTTTTILGALLLSHLQPCLALPRGWVDWSDSAVTPNYDHASNLFKRTNPGDFYLRIMPLGASITVGEPAPDDDEWKTGYRYWLRKKLRADEWDVNMVGNYQSGEMKDNDHEGVSGDRLSAVAKRAETSVPTWRPNLVLVNAGTNDAEGDEDGEEMDKIGDRMKAMIDKIFAEVPDTVVVLSTLLPSEEYQEEIDKINKQYRETAKSYNYAKEGEEPTFKVLLADMGDGWIEKKDLFEGKHPTKEGRRKMASIWMYAINLAAERNWLSEPSNSTKYSNDAESAGKGCKKTLERGNDDLRGGRQVLYATNDVIVSDGDYKHSGKSRDDVEYETSKPYEKGSWDSNVFFGKVTGGPLDDSIFVNGKAKERKIFYRKNNGDGNFGEEVEMPIDDLCAPRGIHFRDVDADGWADFICIAKDGEMFVGKNLAKENETPQFGKIESYKTPESGHGQENVRLADIDGDGRVDYCIIEGNGDIFCWRNTAQDWIGMGQGTPVFTGKDKGDIAGVKFIDLNGDGRDDWTWTDEENGEVTTYINQRGSDKNMVPLWKDAGVTHEGYEDTQKDPIKESDQYMWGFIFGERADYIRVRRGSSVMCLGGHTDCRRYKWQPYENLGEGGKYQKGDGIYFGDVTGTGVDDYIWINPEGAVYVFPNKNTANKTDDYAEPAWGDPVELLTGLTRRQLHVGDWDGDGKADIIGVKDPKSGALQIWYSNGEGTDIDFSRQDQDVADSNKCGVSWGTRYFDNAAHFADLTGNGRVDYICMKPDGTASAWLQHDDGWIDAGQIKVGEGWDRAYYRFADADGDGRADLLWLDPLNGDGTVRYNMDYQPENKDNLHGSSFEWGADEKIYLGSTQGANMYYANLGGEDRADMIGSNAEEGTAEVWFNSCPGGGDDPNAGENNDENTEANPEENTDENVPPPTRRRRQEQAQAEGERGAKVIDDTTAQDDGPLVDPNLPEYEPPEGINVVIQGDGNGEQTQAGSDESQGDAPLEGEGEAPLEGEDDQADTPVGKHNRHNAEGKFKRQEEENNNEDPNLPEYNPEDPSANDVEEPEVIEPGDNWFCGDENAGRWNQQLWTDHKVGEWLMTRSELYAGPDAEWPERDPDRNNEIMGVPRTIARYEGKEKDYAFDWPSGGCTDPRGKCEVTPGSLSEVTGCIKSPERAFSIWAMRNFAQVIQSWQIQFFDGVVEAGFDIANITDVFLAYPEADVQFPISGIFTIFTGIFVGVGAFIPGGGLAVGNVLATSGTILGSALSNIAREKPGLDPRYSNFKDFSAGVGDLMEKGREVMEDLFERLFVEPPPQDDPDRATELARALESGAWANQDSVIDNGVGLTDMKNLITAAMISEAWNAGRVGIVKWAYDGGMSKNWHPCSGNTKWSYKYSDERVDNALNSRYFCRDNWTYVIIPFMEDGMNEIERDHYMEGSMGIHEEALKTYNLNFEKVIDAAERTQERAGIFNPKGLDGLPDIFSRAFGEPDNTQDLMTYFNIPVCNLETVPIEKFDCSYQRPYKCFIHMVSRWCSKMEIQGSDSEWPYQYTRKW